MSESDRVPDRRSTAPTDAVHRVTFDPETERASRAILRALTEADDCDPESMTPLYEAVDPDALDALMQPTTSIGPLASECWVTFTYHDYVVHVHADGLVTLAPSEGERRRDPESERKSPA